MSPADGRDWPALEIVRFEVVAERRRALVDGHLPARRAIRGVSPPGALWSRLAHLGRQRWVEVVAWERRSTFDRALELSQDEPTAREWFELAEPGWTIEVARLVVAPLPPPPRHGHLEISSHGLFWRRVSASGAWTIRGEGDGRKLVDPDGWFETTRRDVSLTVTAGGASETGIRSPLRSKESREGGQIIDAIDAREEQVPLQ
jgi:hypothetical protein